MTKIKVALGSAVLLDDNDTLTRGLRRLGFEVVPFTFNQNNPDIAECEALIAEVRSPSELTATISSFVTNATPNPYVIAHFASAQVSLSSQVTFWELGLDVDASKRKFLRTHFPGRPVAKIAVLASMVVAMLTLVWFGGATLSRPAEKGPPQIDLTEVRLALVIDQGAYQNNVAVLKNTEAEADLVETALKDVKFDVKRYHDLRRDQLRDALKKFQDRVGAAGRQAVVFVYFTGHGAQTGQVADSYLLGVDANIESPADVAKWGVSLEEQRQAFDELDAKGVILVFDACRDVPSTKSTAATKSAFAKLKGLGPVRDTENMLVAYATKEGEVAKENVFAPILAGYITRANLEAAAMFTAIQRDVAAKTNNQQLPRVSPQLYRQICLAGCSN